MELMNCPSLAVPQDVMRHVVRVESSNNPFAIGVVGGRLARQPRNLSEALATVRMLEGRGYNFSVGLAQVNRYNLDKYGLGSYEKAFQACPNLQAGSRILADCHGRSGGNWGKSFSCYYAGNFVTGFRQGYVQKVYASMRKDPVLQHSIDVVSKPSRRSVAVSRYPLYEAPRRTQPVTADVANDVPRAVPAAQSDVSQPIVQIGAAADTPQIAASDDSRPVIVAPMVPVDRQGVAVTGSPSRGGDQAFVF
ncbi:lytic transglycosylase domain-containing protein [Lysobacter fragariae]